MLPPAAQPPFCPPPPPPAVESHSHELGECCELRDTERVDDEPGLPLLRGEPGGISSCRAAIGEAPGPAGSWPGGEVRGAGPEDVETARPFSGTGTMPGSRRRRGQDSVLITSKISTSPTVTVTLLKQVEF